jgi:hypothetical protein
LWGGTEDFWADALRPQGCVMLRVTYCLALARWKLSRVPGFSLLVRRPQADPPGVEAVLLPGIVPHQAQVLDQAGQPVRLRQVMSVQLDQHL